MATITAVRLPNVVPKFDPRSRPFYLLLGGSALLTWAMLALTGIDVSHALQFGGAAWAALAILLATMLRRVGNERASTGIETVATTVLMALVLIAIQYPLAALPLPLADGILLKADRLLGFDWLTFAVQFHDPRALALLRWAYVSMSPQAALVPAFLAWRGETSRAWQFVTAAAILFAASIAIFPLFPADGRFVLCGLHPDFIPAVDRSCGYAPILHHLKDGTLTVIRPSMVIGLVTFPSAHAACGLALTWAVWPSRLLRWPAVLLNTALCIGAIVIGSHYLIDILGGLAVGSASIYCAGRLIGSSIPRTARDAGASEARD